MGSRAMKGRYGVRKKNKKSVVLSVIAVLCAVVVACVVGAFALAQSWLQDLPDYTDLSEFNTSQPSRIWDSSHTTLLAEFQLENREPVEIDEISPLVLEGTIATEDERFRDHNGVDLYGVFRAVANNLMGGDLEGASTITQQLVRNTILSDEMNDISFKRKVREMYIALKMEEFYSKDEILLMYLNTINYGSGAYGIEAASERYFSKHADELTLNEAATLIGIPQSPTYNNPVDNMDNCVARRNVVLDRMVSNGVVTQAEADQVKSEPIVLNETIPSSNGLLAYPYFTSYVRNQLLNSDMYGFTAANVFGGGLDITTTLDIDDQEAAQAAADEKLSSIGYDYDVALVSIEPDTGFIRALIGGKDENYQNDQVNMATGEGGSGRQVGSSAKTFTLVAAIEAGIDPQTIIDAGASMEIPGGRTVHNYGYSDYGVTTIANAFAVSSNTAFTRLALSVGVDEVIDTAERLGITSSLTHASGVTLGIDSISPLEMASAYATIANGGTHYEPQAIYKIVNQDGETIVDNSNPEGERVISEEVACAAIEVMQGVVQHGTATNVHIANGQPVAGKTGTTETEQDSWFVGFTPQLSTAVWLGEKAENYVDARPVYSEASTVFDSYMNTVLEGQAVQRFPTAPDPDYDTSYSDAEYHIGYSGWSYTWSSSDSDDNGDDYGSSDSSWESSGSSQSGNAGSSDSETGGGGQDPSGGGGADSGGGAGDGGGDGNGGTTIGDETGGGAGDPVPASSGGRSADHLSN